MIGYFIKAGDVKVDENFSPYAFLYGNIIDQTIVEKNYGTGLKLILIEYLLEGDFMAFPKKRIIITPLRKKEQAISVRIGVPKDFGEWNEQDKKWFVVNTTREAVQLVRDHLFKNINIDINFTQLTMDLDQCAVLYLGKN